MNTVPVILPTAYTVQPTDRNLRILCNRYSKAIILIISVMNDRKDRVTVLGGACTIARLFLGAPHFK